MVTTEMVTTEMVTTEMVTGYFKSHFMPKMLYM